MSVLAALLFASAQVAAAPPPPAVAEEITVIGRKLKTWKGTVKKRDNAYVCKMTKSTGDKVIDAIRCDAMRYCMGQVNGEAQIILAPDAPKRERNARLNRMLGARMPACLETYEDSAVRKLAEERAGV